MPTKRTNGAKANVIRCPNCGEDYSVTYKRCPFCDEKTARRAERSYEQEKDNYDDDYDEDDEDLAGKSGGKRLNGGGRRGGGYSDAWTPMRIAGTVVSLGIIVAAIWIVVTVLGPLVSNGNLAVTPSPGLTSPNVTPTPAATPTLPAGGVIVTPGPDDEPEPTPSAQIPASQTATSFTLNKSDFTLGAGEAYQLKVTFLPAGSTGTITWTSSKPDVVSVSENGTTKGVGKGSATITATMAGGQKQECIVRSNGGGTASGTGDTSGNSTGGSGSTSGSSSGTASGTLSLNRTDFTMTNGETYKLKVSGTSSNPTWSIGNTSVATISGDGTVTAMGKGSTTITCKVDGQTLTCTVRCSG